MSPPHPPPPKTLTTQPLCPSFFSFPCALFFVPASPILQKIPVFLTRFLETPPRERKDPFAFCACPCPLLFSSRRFCRPPVFLLGPPPGCGLSPTHPFLGPGAARPPVVPRAPLPCPFPLPPPFFLFLLAFPVAPPPPKARIQNLPAFRPVGGDAHSPPVRCFFFLFFFILLFFFACRGWFVGLPLRVPSAAGVLFFRRSPAPPISWGRGPAACRISSPRIRKKEKGPPPPPPPSLGFFFHNNNCLKPIPCSYTTPYSGALTRFFVSLLSPFKSPLPVTLRLYFPPPPLLDPSRP